MDSQLGETGTRHQWPDRVFHWTMALSVIVLFVAIGLTAYDSQQIKEMYSELDGSDIVAKKAIMGALRLYMDFILIFQNLLYLTGMLEE